MKTLMSRTGAVLLAVVLQAILATIAVAPRLSAHLTGTEYRLAVEPVDPMDPFRGAYVALSYPGLPEMPLPPMKVVDGEEIVEDSPGVGTVYVPLTRDGAVWRGSAIVRSRPAKGPYLACKDHGGGTQPTCGIESLFLPQDKARAAEADLAGGRTVAVIKVDGRGNAAILRLERRG